MRRLAALLAAAAFATSGRASIAGEAPSPEAPGDVVFLDRIGPGEGAPTREGLAKRVVLTEVSEHDRMYEVVRVLQARGADAVVPFTAGRMEPVFARLRRIAPGTVAVVLRPETLDVHFHFDFLERASRLDDDPFVDFAFGYFTGATAEEAVAFAKGSAPSAAGEHPRSILEFGPSRPLPVTEASAHPWAQGFTTRSLAHAEGAKDVAESLAAVRVGVLSAWGHGMPDGVSGGLQGAQVRSAALDLSGTLYFSGPCFCGVTADWWEPSGNVAIRRRVGQDNSFVLALVGARAAGVFAGLDPDRGETNRHELEHLLLTGESLGMASKSTYDQAVLAYRRPALDLPRHSATGPAFRDVHDQMISGGACRALFGDPTYVPFRRAGKDPFAVATKPTSEGLSVSWASGPELGPYWTPVDVFRAHGFWTHRLLFRFETTREQAKSLRAFRVLSVTKDGQPLPYAYPTAALESWGGSVRVHVLLVLPTKDQRVPHDRPLFGGNRYAAEVLFAPKAR